MTGEERSRLQDAVLSITKDITALCGRHGIQYSLGGGSALGAVRHHGFIPWDDDIDLNVERRYLDPLCDLVEQEMGDRYSVCRPGITDQYYSSFVQIHAKGTLCREDLHTPDALCGIKIDVFPYDNTFGSGFLRFLHGIACDGISFVLSCMRMSMFRKEYLKLTHSNAEASKTIRVKALIGMFFTGTPQALMRFAQRIYRLCPDEESYYVSCPTGRGHFFGEIRPRAGLRKTVKVPYEDTEFSVTKDVRAYLKMLYGPDYMALPPEEEREQHVLYELRFK